MESKNEKIFTFNDEFYFGDPKDKRTCETKITIIDKISNNSPVYVINYEHKIITPQKSYIIQKLEDLVIPCPFAYFDDNVKECYEGVIVIKNPMTTSMVDMIMMDDEELEKYSGNSTAENYRRNIMVNITNFWD